MYQTSVRVYAILLRLYPERFRREYGPLMLHAFRDQLREIAPADRGALAWLWLRTMSDVSLNVIGEHMNALRFSQERGQYLRLVPGILFVGATWPVLFMSLMLSLVMAADPGAQGAAAGSVQETIARVLGRPPIMSLVAFGIMAVTCGILWRASIGQRDDAGLPVRVGVVSLAACPILIGAMLLGQRVVTGDAAPFVLLAIWGVLVAGMLYSQYRAAFHRRRMLAVQG